MQFRLVALLCAAHMVTDINQGALPALLPFLISEYHLSYAAAAFIVFASNIASTVVQPVFGHLADRITKPWLMPGGVVLAAVGIGALGFVSDYHWVLVSSMVSGVGVAAFHPQAARLVSRVSGEQKGSAMSVFGVGGTLGFALGPAIMTAALLYWGVKGSAIVLLPAVIMAVILTRRLSARAEEAPRSAVSAGLASAPKPRDAWAPFARLTGVVMARATLFFGLNTFIPLYWIHVLHMSKASGATALSLFALAGVIGNLLGGRLADRIGHPRVASLGFCALIPLLPALVLMTQASAALAVLVLMGFALSATYSPVIVLGQRYLPNHVGLSSGVTLGLAITFGGVTTPLLGWMADHYGLWGALASLCLVPILATGLALTLPAPEG
jgi:MFS transporter, FSR family, fosmidomycin resistance protein